MLQVAILTAGAVVGSVAPAIINRPSASIVPKAYAAPTVSTERSAHDPIPLKALGIKRGDFVSERELRRKKTTQYSEAEQEIMELEEWEVETQWFRDLQIMWAGIASVGGIFVLYKGGVMWENWIKEQEKKDMEEEIELTGTFIDPRAVRKDEDEEGDQKSNNSSSNPSDSDGDNNNSQPSTSPQSPNDSDSPSDDLDSLEKLFGKS